MSSTAATDERHVVLPATTASIRTARQAVAATLPAQTPPDICADALLAISELASNAVEHGVGDTFSVDVRTTPQLVEMVVESAIDQAEIAAERLRREETLRPGSERSGRGLAIVKALADDYDFRVVRDRLVARCRLRLYATH